MLIVGGTTLAKRIVSVSASEGYFFWSTESASNGAKLTKIGVWRFKDGGVLIKSLDRPFCQTRDFGVGQK